MNCILNFFFIKTVLFSCSQATIWQRKPETREKMYAAANPTHQKMIYLPRHIFLVATNIRDVAINFAKSLKLENKVNIDQVSVNMFEKLPWRIWLPAMDNLDFFTINEDGCSEDETPDVKTSTKSKNSPNAPKNYYSYAK